MKYFKAAGVALVLSAFCAAPVVAQGKAKESATSIADTEKALVGTWEGKYTSDHAPTGGMQLVIKRDSTLKISSLAMTMGQETPTIPTHGLVVSDTDISWKQDMMGMTCDATAVLSEGQLKGAIICAHASVNFSLSKNK